MMDDLKLELEELNDLKGMVNSDTFRKYILEPMQKEVDELKPAYDCDTLRQLNTLKGKEQGLRTFFSLIENIDTRINNKQLEINQLDSNS